MLDQKLIFSLDVIDKDGNLIKNAPIGAYTKNISHNGNSLEEYLNTLAKASGIDQSIALKNTVENNKVVLTLQINDKEVSTEFSPNDVENWTEIVGRPEIMPGTGASSLILKSQWSDANEASATYAIALGANVKAQAYASSAFGTSCQAKGEGSIAAGGSSIAGQVLKDGTILGKNALAVGSLAKAYQNHSMAIGIGVLSNGLGALATGNHTEAHGAYSHTEGSDTKVFSGGENGHAEGKSTKVYAKNAHAEGQETQAGMEDGSGGSASHAEGYLSKALVWTSHAEGNNTEASGENGSHAEGWETKAKGRASHAEGRNVEAKGEASHASGFYTIADKDYQTVIGKYNEVSSEKNYAFIIGNGTSTANRKNALVVDWDGNLQIQGSLTVGATPLEETSLQSLLNNNYTLKAGNNITFGYDEENKIITINSLATGGSGESGTSITYSLEYSNNLLTLSGTDGSVSSVNVLDFAVITQEEIDALFE